MDWASFSTMKEDERDRGVSRNRSAGSQQAPRTELDLHALHLMGKFNLLILAAIHL
jgi:hypothetical protein